MRAASLVSSVIAAAALATPAANAMEIVNKKIVFESVNDLVECTDKFPGRSADCMNALDAWLKKQPDTDMMATAKLVQKRQNAYVAVPYYKAAFDKKKGDCTDTDALDAVVAGFQLPSDAKQIPMGKSLAFDTCWKEWKDDLAGQVDAKNSYYLKNVCPELTKKKALNAERQKICNS